MTPPNALQPQQPFARVIRLEGDWRLIPLVPPASTMTAGILVDRWFCPAWPAWVAAALAAIVGSIVAARRRQDRLTLFFMFVVAGCLGGLWHQLCHWAPANDIASQARSPPRVAKLRGTVVDGPVVLKQKYDPLRSRPLLERAVFLMEVEQVSGSADWQPAAGTVKVWASSPLANLRTGDNIEAVGELSELPRPMNPGEADLAAAARDQGIRAYFFVASSDAIQVRRYALSWQLTGLPARLRARAIAVLNEELPQRRAGVAAALLLGEQTAIDPQLLKGYLRTGVFHALAISGQHLVFLCGALWPLLRWSGVRRRHAAIVVSGFVIFYTLLTGGQPPIVRAATIVVALCGAILLRRKVQPINSLTLAWIVVALINPSSIFQTGTQLSFVAVLVLYQIVGPWHDRGTMVDPLEKLIYKSRPIWQRALLSLGKWLKWSLLASAVVWLSLAPLLATRFHLVSPIAIVLSPPMVLLTGLALVAGGLLLLFGPLASWLAAPLAWVVSVLLGACEVLVEWSERLPGGYWYTPGASEWWLGVFYSGLAAALVVPGARRYWRQALAMGLGWFCLGWMLDRPQKLPANEVTCTFLSVGHGGCTVVELEDGRILLYDAGSLAGPEVAARQIAPYLWSRGVTGIDEVFLSHADLDHFNGLLELLDRFRIGRVTLTPSFREKPSPGVQLVLKELERRRIPIQVVRAGNQLRAGKVTIEVWHPPVEGLEGPDENPRSMVLLIVFAEQKVLLTGDLSGKGLGRLMNFVPAPKGIQVMQAPHHGSASANTQEFARWVQAGLVISSESRPLTPKPDPYREFGGELWRTWEEGAVMVRLRREGIVAEGYYSGRRWTSSGQ